MKWLLLELVLLFQFPPPPPPPPPPPLPVRVSGEIPQTGEGLIDGVVRRWSSDDPVSGAQVILTGPPGAANAVQQLIAVTGVDGRFTFDNIPAGRYTVAARRDGYFLPRSIAGNPSSGQVVVNPGRSAAAVALALVQGGTISGRILDPMGRPSVATTVTAARQYFQDGRPSLGPVKSTASDDRGDYRLFWLEPGEYLVMAEKTLPTGRARGYFPGNDDGRSAITVVVSEGAESAKTDFSLGNIPAAVTISGAVNMVISSVDSPTKSSTSDALVPQFFLLPVDAGRIYEGMSMFSNALTGAEDRAAGKFELRNVRSGSYELFAVVQDRSTAPSRYYVAHQAIDVGSQDLGGISLTVKQGIDLKGTISAGVGKPPPSARVQLRPRALLPNWQGAGVISTDGTFSFPNVPELEYTIMVEPLEPNSYVAELLYGRDSILDRGVMTVARGFPDTLEALIQAPAATVRGTVSAPPPLLSGGIIITLVPEESRRENLSLYKRAITRDGSFSFAGVSPGKYKLLAWERIPDGAEFSVDFMDSYKSNGEEVAVAPGGGTSSVELRLISK